MSTPRKRYLHDIAGGRCARCGKTALQIDQEGASSECVSDGAAEARARRAQEDAAFGQVWAHYRRARENGAPP